MVTVTYEDQSVNVRNGAAPEGAQLFETAFWTATQVYTYLGVTAMTLNRWVRKGPVPVTVFDGRYYFTRDQLRRVTHYCRDTVGLPGDYRDRYVGDPKYLESVQRPSARGVYDRP